MRDKAAYTGQQAVLYILVQRPPTKEDQQHLGPSSEKNC